MSDGGRASERGPLTDQVLGERYRLGTILGRGGMGVVYTALQVSLDRPVAIKVLQPALAEHIDAVARFRAEAERAGRLAHPHIVQILDFGREADGSAWIAMELLAGQALSDRIAKGPLSETEVVKVALETLSALEAAHGASLVHRDLKPDNVFLATVPGIGATVKVLDFGIAKLLDGDHANRLTATGTLVGTPLYMSPEQARGADVDGRSDLYSLGALLYEALTLQPPFTGSSYSALLLSLMTDTPRPIAELRPEVTPALAAIVLRAMSKRVDDRYASASDMATALRALSPTESVPTLLGARDLAVAMAPTLGTPEPFAMAETSPAVSLSPSSAPLAAAPAQRPAPAPEARSATVARDDASGATTATSASSTRTVAAALGGALVMLAVVGVGWQLVGGPSEPAPSTSPLSTRDEPTPTTTTTTTTATTTTADPRASAAGDRRAGDLMQPMELPSAAETAPTVTPTEPAVAQPIVEPTEPHDPGETGEPSEPPRRRVDPEIAAARAQARRGFTPRVGYSGSSYSGMTSSADLSGPINTTGGWAQCWPREVPPPVENRGREFSITIAGDGEVLAVSPTPQSTEPAAFAQCAAARLRTIHFPPPRDGIEAHVRVTFHVE